MAEYSRRDLLHRAQVATSVEPTSLDGETLHAIVDPIDSDRDYILAERPLITAILQALPNDTVIILEEPDDA